MIEKMGVGVDIECVDRFKEASNTFLNKIFTESELAYCFSKVNPAQHLAVRFAGKEAVIKALGSFGRNIVDFKKIEITRNTNGVPFVKLSDMDDINVKISLSHCKNKAIAFVVITKN